MRKATLRITVTERGNLESCVTVDGICEVNANQIKIISLVPEGTKVKKGDIVCKFDSSEIDKNIAQQDIKVKQAVAKIETTQQELEIQRNKGESDIIAAKVEMTLAKLDLEKYQKGDSRPRRPSRRARSGSRRKTSKRRRTSSISIKQLMKKGFKSPELVTGFRRPPSPRPSSSTRVPSSSSRSRRNTTTRGRRPSSASKADQAQKKVEQAVATLKAQMSKATSEYESAKATADIEQQQFKEFLKQKDKTIIRAGQDGVVAYANDAWYDSSRQIREGATVYSLQKIFTLPDMTKMQVKVNIHESLIKKIKVGQKAEIRIESFPSIVFVGTVTSVSQLADSTRPWMTGGVKQYPTVVKLDDLKAQDLKPGMTAEAKVLVGELDNVLRRARAGRRRAQGRVLRLRREARGHQASKSEDRRKQRDARPNPRGARRRANRSRSTPGCGPPPNSSSTKTSKAATNPSPTISGRAGRPPSPHRADSELHRDRRADPGDPEETHHASALHHGPPGDAQPHAAQAARSLDRSSGLIFGVVVGDRHAGDRRRGQPRSPAPDRLAGRDQRHHPQHEAAGRCQPVQAAEQ